MIIFFKQLKVILSVVQLLKELCFLQIILQALLDATQKDSNDLESCKYKREAILWFTTKHGKKKKILNIFVS